MIKQIEKCKTMFKEWIVLTLISFFLYDVIWAIADLENFKQSIEGNYYLFMDLIYSGIFSLVSLSVNQVLLKMRFFKLAETERKRFLSSVTVIVSINIFFASVFDLLLNVIYPDFMEEDVWGTFFLFVALFRRDNPYE